MNAESLSIWLESFGGRLEPCISDRDGKQRGWYLHREASLPPKHFMHLDIINNWCKSACLQYVFNKSWAELLFEKYLNNIEPGDEAIYAWAFKCPHPRSREISTLTHSLPQNYPYEHTLPEGMWGFFEENRINPFDEESHDIRLFLSKMILLREKDNLKKSTPLAKASPQKKRL